MAEHESNLAVLVDFENMARPGAKGRGDFDIHLVLNRLADKGRVLVKRAYADWSRYRDARHELQNAGLGLIEMPSAREGAKNRADIQMAVDAMELAYSREHVDTFVIVSGDSDFTPLIGKLRELNKRVTGVGNRESASELLIANCDEFIFYDLLAARGRETRTGPGGKTEPLDLLRGTLTALQREGVEWPLASVVKDSMRRKYPAFDESDHGFSTFSKFLEDAAKQDIVRLETDPRSGTYRVELTDGRDEVPALPAALEERAPEPASETGRRRRRRARRGSSDAESDGESAEETLDSGAETFEFVVSSKPIEAVELPPLDEPISYEDMIMLGPEAGDDLPEELAEATDLDESGPPARSARRRRRRGASAEPEPTAADLTALGDDEDEAAAPAAEDAAEAEAAALEAVAAEAAAETPAAGEAAEAQEPAEATPSRRRRRRRSSAAEAATETAEGAAEEPAEGAAEGEAPAEPVAEEPAAEAAAQEPEAAAQEEPEAEAAEPEPAPAPEPAAPKRTRGRVPRGTVRVADVEPAPAEDAAPAATEEAPAAPKRRTRKKAEPPAEEAGTAEEAPAPKRRTRKKAEPPAEEAGTAEAPAEEAPAPKRRTRKKAEPAAEAGAEEAPAAPKRRTRKKAEPPAEEAGESAPAAEEAAAAAESTAGGE